MTGEQLLGARGFKALNKNENFDIFINSFRGQQIVFNHKDKSYQIYDIIYGNKINISPKLHEAISMYMQELNYYEKYFYHRLKKEREKLCLTINEAADGAGVSHRTIFKFENNEKISKEMTKKIYNYYIDLGVQMI